MLGKFCNISLRSCSVKYFMTVESKTNIMPECLDIPFFMLLAFYSMLYEIYSHWKNRLDKFDNSTPITWTLETFSEINLCLSKCHPIVSKCCSFCAKQSYKIRSSIIMTEDEWDLWYISVWTKISLKNENDDWKIIVLIYSKTFICFCQWYKSTPK